MIALFWGQALTQNYLSIDCAIAMNSRSGELLDIGLTGGIGSGKSTVAALFAEHGATIIDSDAISHSLTQSGGGCHRSHPTAFGDSYIDRQRSDGQGTNASTGILRFRCKQRLEAILHPLIQSADAGTGRSLCR